MAGLISYRNLIDSSSAVLSATGTVVGAYPLANLTTRQLSTVTRIQRVSLQTFQMEIFVDRGVGAPVVGGGGVAAVIGINAVPGSPQVTRLTVSSGTDGISYVGIGTTENAFVDAGVLKLPQSIFCEITGPIQRYVRVTGQWFVGPGINYGQIGRLWLGPAIVLGAGVDDKWELDFVDPGSLVRSAGGQAHEAPRQRTRVVRCTATGLTSLHAFGVDNNVSSGDVPSLQGMQMEAGLTGEVILMPRSKLDIWNRRMAIYGSLDPSGRGSIRKSAGDFYDTSLAVIEER